MIPFFACLLCTTLHIPSIILRYIPFKNKITKKQKMILYAIYTVSLVINFLLMYYAQYRGELTIGLYKLNLTVFCMLMTCVNIVVVRGFVKEQLFTYGLVSIIILMEFSVAVFITDKIIPTDVNMQLIVCNLIIILIFCTTYESISHFVKSTITPFLDYKNKSYWNTIWFIPISMFLASVLSNQMDSHVTSVSQLISRMLVGVATLFLCYSIAPDYKLFMEKEKLNQQVSLQKKYYAALTEKVQAEREARHNFKHHIAAINGFIDADDKQGLIKYFERFEALQPQDTQIPYTGNTAVDGVFYHYATIAVAENIQFDVQCSLNNIGISDIDLCSLLGNALDNAITACKKYDKERYIRIVSEKSAGFLAITIDNSFNGEIQIVNGKILSSKRDNEEGIGIASMKKICADYNGKSKFTVQQNQFEASFLLKI